MIGAASLPRECIRGIEKEGEYRFTKASESASRKKWTSAWQPPSSGHIFAHRGSGLLSYLDLPKRSLAHHKSANNILVSFLDTRRKKKGEEGVYISLGNILGEAFQHHYQTRSNSITAPTSLVSVLRLIGVFMAAIAVILSIFT